MRKLKFVSYTSNLSEQMYDFQKRTMFLQKWILNPQDLLQNLSLETIPVCIAWQYFRHNNTVCIHMCDGCKNQTTKSFVTACDLRAPHRLTRPAFEAHSGVNTFPPEADPLWSHFSTGPSASRNTFQCPRSRTATLG